MFSCLRELVNLVFTREISLSIWFRFWVFCSISVPKSTMLLSIAKQLYFPFISAFSRVRSYQNYFFRSTSRYRRGLFFFISAPSRYRMNQKNNFQVVSRYGKGILYFISTSSIYGRYQKNNFLGVSKYRRYQKLFFLRGFHVWKGAIFFYFYLFQI